MKRGWLYFLFLLYCFPFPLNAQVTTNSGSIYGRVLDENGSSLRGVSADLESDVIPAQLATTGTTGAFRFANLPPGNYVATFGLPGFTEVRQEEIRITIGLNLELTVVMKQSPTQEIVVSGEPPHLDTQKTGNETTYSREHLDQIPGGRDPWFVLEQSPGIDSDRYNVAGSESGNQSIYYARGGNFQNVWNFDGVNLTSFGGAPVYPDFDSFEEIEIVTGGNDASIQSGGVVINLVTKRGGNKWAANASYYLVDDSLQSDNTPQELIDDPILNPITGEPAEGSNRTNQIQEYGFDIGGPVLKDRLFVWGAFRRNRIAQFSINDVPDNTTLLNYNLKISYNFNSENESQFGYWWANKTKSGRAFFPGEQAPETLSDQESNVGSLPLYGYWSAQHTWIPNDRLLMAARYAYVGESFGIVPRGGSDVPIIFLAAIPQWEQTFFVGSPIERPAHDATVDVNYFKEDWLGADHELKFGFAYQHTSAHSFASYGNGILLYDYYQTNPGGALTAGQLTAQHYADSNISFGGFGLYASDTIRKDRMTLNLGCRFDHQSGKNGPSHIPGVPGFEQYVGPFDYPGGDPGIAWNNISPRVGITYDFTGEGKTILRGNFARYYDSFDTNLLAFSNPATTYNGAIFAYMNQNGDRVITPEEVVSDPRYYGGLSSGGFNLDEFLEKRKYSDDLSNAWTNELILGIEHEFFKDFSLSGTYTYRRYGNFQRAVPFGVTTADYDPAGVFHADTPIGTFDVPYFVLGFKHDGNAIFTNVEDHRKTYHGLDLIARKKMSRNFLLSVSLTLQRQRAHYNGGDSLAVAPFISFPGSTYAFDPTNQPFVDDQSYAYSGRFGIRPFSEWYLRTSGYYQFPVQIGVGAYLRYQQGYPYVLSGAVFDPTLVAFYNTPIHRFLVEPFGSRRLDNKFTLDLRIEKEIELGQSGRITAIVDVFNVTNENAVLRRNNQIGVLRGDNLIGTEQFYRIQEVISPRAVRFGIRYNY